MHAVEQGLRSGLTHVLPDLWRATADLLFDGVECGDALDRFRRRG